MLDVNDTQDGELLGTIAMGPDGVLTTAGLGTELVEGWRAHGFEDSTIYTQILPGWSNGYIEVVPGMPDPSDVDSDLEPSGQTNVDSPQGTGGASDLGKVDEGAVGKFKARNLIKWFNEGADGQIIWGKKGDFDKCSRLAMEHGHMTPEQAHGFCNLRHRDATGAAPGHAPAEAAEHAVTKADAPPITNPHQSLDYDPAALGITGPTHLIEVDPQVPNVDRQNYQRDLNLDRVALYESMPKKDLRKRVGLLARRPDGSLWTIDGQHHTLAAIGRGVGKLPYRVFDSTGPKQEAAVYQAWNQHERGN